MIRFATQRFAALAQRFFVVSKTDGNGSQVPVWHKVSRIGLLPQFVGLRCLLQLSGHVPIVEGLNAESLTFAHLLSQLVRLAGILCRQSYFVEVGLGNRQSEERLSKIRVEFYRSF